MNFRLSSWFLVTRITFAEIVNCIGNHDALCRAGIALVEICAVALVNDLAFFAVPSKTFFAFALITSNCVYTDAILLVTVI